jgi:PAS domain S-box-containing protein
MGRSFRRAGLLAAIFLFLALPAAAPAQPPDILILHSYHMGQVWTDGVMAGMQKVLGPHGEDLRLHVEYMDTKRYHDPVYLTEMLDLLLTYKLQRLHFDLLLLSDNDALNFAVRHRHGLFADTPIVFCGINNFQPEMIAGVSDITGVAEYPNFSETIRLALRFHPQTQGVVVIGNTRNETDLQNYQLFLEAVPEFSDRLAFEHWDDLPMNELADHLADLPPDTLVFINGLITDEAGLTLPFVESNQRIREVTDAPLYSGWDFFLGDGIVGGRLVSSRRHGQLAAQLALRVLNGEDADSIPVITEGTNEYMFDDRQLRRLGISHRELPPGSIIINRPDPFLHLSRGEVFLGLALAAILSLLLLVLFLTMARQRRAERELRENQERFRTIADYTCGWEWWSAPDGRLSWVNPQVQKETGYSVAECMAMADYPATILHEEERELVMNDFRQAIGERVGGRRNLRIRRKDGEVRWMAAAWQPVLDKIGAYSGLRVGARDVTDRQLAQEELQNTNEELDAFVRTVSHDLRAPLTPIIGHAEMLRYFGVENDADLRLAAAAIEESGRRMLTILEDLLTLSRAGCLQLPEEPIRVADVLIEVLANLAAPIAETGAVIVPAPCPALRIPRSTLALALENLIGNAVRYAGRSGPIEVGGSCRGERVRLYVRDHGPGIPEGERERIFEPFYRGQGEAGSLPGTGVGLATVRRIARRCGGRVWVEETPGGGSTFWLELETAECRMPEEAS